jgi:hypothetical protein
LLPQYTRSVELGEIDGRGLVVLGVVALDQNMMRNSAAGRR